MDEIVDEAEVGRDDEYDDTYEDIEEDIAEDLGDEEADNDRTLPRWGRPYAAPRK